MKYNPHPYQRQAIDFILDHPEAAVFLGLGMGKTIITLTAINTLLRDRFEVARVLVIAPVRVARDTWPAELDKWDHLQGLRVAPMVGSKKQRLAALHADADIWTIGRENVGWLVKELGKAWPFDMVVIDELSSFKSHQSQRFKALRTTRPHIRRIVGLTGTPAPNSLLDLWAPYRLLDEGTRLGATVTEYRDKYFAPGKRNGHIVYEWKLRPGADTAIHERIRDITLSMKTSDYLTLPEATYLTRTVHMSDTQRRAYLRLKTDMVLPLADGGMVAASNAATLSGKLQQLASGAIYADDGATARVHDAKIQALADIVDEAEGEPVLVAYWFRHELERICEVIPQARQLSSQDDFKDWNAGSVPVGLIHPASAGHGLNLQAGGHILVWTTVPWSLELYEQTNARLHRQGQQHPVTIIHLATAGTIDDQVRRALAAKAMTQGALIDAVAAQLD